MLPNNDDFDSPLSSGTLELLRAARALAQRTGHDEPNVLHLVYALITLEPNEVSRWHEEVGIDPPSIWLRMTATLPRETHLAGAEFFLRHQRHWSQEDLRHLLQHPEVGRIYWGHQRRTEPH